MLYIFVTVQFMGAVGEDFTRSRERQKTLPSLSAPSYPPPNFHSSPPKSSSVSSNPVGINSSHRDRTSVSSLDVSDQWGETPPMVPTRTTARLELMESSPLYDSPRVSNAVWDPSLEKVDMFAVTQVSSVIPLSEDEENNSCKILSLINFLQFFSLPPLFFPYFRIKTFLITVLCLLFFDQ